MKSSTIQLALRADQAMSRNLPDRLFGHFSAPNYSGAVTRFAFEALRYAYVGTPLALQIWSIGQDSHGMWDPYMTLTVNFRPNDCKDDEIIVKAYEENEHLRGALLGLGLFEDTGRRIQSGYASLEIWRLTDNFVEAFDKAISEELAL